MNKNIWKKLCNRAEKDGACHLVLLDPDKGNPDLLASNAKKCEKSGVDGLLVGGSLMENKKFKKSMKAIYDSVKIPVILFPGKFDQVVEHADAILFTSLISGDNSDFLIKEQIKGAPFVKKFGLEAIPTGYVLVESGNVTAVERVSATKPVSRKNIKEVVNIALAAQYLGMNTIYLEAGSGARKTVPNKMITSVSQNSNLHVIVGGGIRTPKQAIEKVEAGADFIVTGTVFEDDNNIKLIKEIRNAVKSVKK